MNSDQPFFSIIIPRYARRKFFYLRMLLCRERKERPWRVWRIRFLFAVGQAANAAGFLWESFTGRSI